MIWTKDEQEESDSQELASTNDSITRYPVRIVFCGSNLYRCSLRDLDGNYIQDAHGNNLNVFSKVFAKALVDKQIRLIHCINPGYRYFTTCQLQYQSFCQIRKEGWSSTIPGVCFYLYDDEDCLYLSNHFKGAILNFE